ncbi:helix-turn-helix domain-containing protein [Roseibium sp. M-1]
MARPAKPKTEVAQRLIQVRGAFSRDDFAQSLGIVAGTYANYERGNVEPSISVLQTIAHVHQINLHWLLTGHGTHALAADIQPAVDTLSQYRGFVHAVVSVFWEQLPHETLPQQAAEEFVNILDYLIEREDMTYEAALEIARFSAKRLRKP